MLTLSRKFYPNGVSRTISNNGFVSIRTKRGTWKTWKTGCAVKIVYARVCVDAYRGHFWMKLDKIGGNFCWKIHARAKHKTNTKIAWGTTKHTYETTMELNVFNKEACAWVVSTFTQSAEQICICTFRIHSATTQSLLQYFGIVSYCGYDWTVRYGECLFVFVFVFTSFVACNKVPRALQMFVLQKRTKPLEYSL